MIAAQRRLQAHRLGMAFIDSGLAGIGGDPTEAAPTPAAGSIAGTTTSNSNHSSCSCCFYVFSSSAAVKPQTLKQTTGIQAILQCHIKGTVAEK